MTDPANVPSDRRTLLAGIGGLAAGTFLAAGRAQAGPLVPSSPPAPTGKPLAEVEPRIAINEANTPGDAQYTFIITEPGSYYLTANLIADSARDAIAIHATGVSLNLMGFTLDGIGAPGNRRAITFGLNVSDVQIIGGYVRNWVSGGIVANNVPRVALAGVHVRDCGGTPMICGEQSRIVECSLVNCLGAAPALRVGPHSHVLDCQIHGVGGVGISCDTSCVVHGCSIVEAASNGIDAQTDCSVVGNRVISCAGAGVRILNTAQKVSVRDNTLVGNHRGLYIQGVGNFVADNVVRDSTSANYDIVQGNQLNILLCQIPQGIPWPCSIKLVGSLTGVSDSAGISVSSPGVSIDLNGHELVGVPGSGDAIVSSNAQGLRISNGTLRNWGGRGTFLRNSPEALLKDVTSSSNGSTGFTLGGYSRIENCTASSNGAVGYYPWDFAGGGIQYVNCSALSNGGIGFQVPSGSSLSNCIAEGNENHGVSVSNSVISNCMSRLNEGTGFQLSSGVTLTNSSAIDNEQNGIRVNSNCIVKGCLCRGNGIASGFAGIMVALGSNRIEGNNVTNNTSGIRILAGGNFIVGNSANGNGDSQDYIISGTNTIGPIITATGTIADTVSPWANFQY